MGRQDRAIGLDRLPVANGGRTAEVFLTGSAYLTGHAEHDPDELAGVRHGLGIRSIMCVPLEIGGERRGVLLVVSAQPDFFSAEDLRSCATVARWVGLVAQRAEQVDRLTQAAADRGRQVAAEDLIAVLAHDLGNFLTPLKARIDMLRRRAQRDGRQRDQEDAAAAAQALGRLRGMVELLLDVARLEQGLFSIQTQPVDLVQLAHDTAAALETPETAIEVRAPRTAPAYVDPDRLRQALENLLANAVKHSPAGAPVVLAVGREQRDGAAYATLAVSDQGPGVPPELLPRIFERFVSGPNASGLGLGLYLARGIAAAHGGTLTVRSTPGQGATFTLAVPTHADEDEDE